MDGSDDSHLPGTLGEYLRIWCADLLKPLDDEQLGRVRNGIHMMYTGGAYLRRLAVQRLVEIELGVVSADAALGEVLAGTPAGLNSLIADLENPQRRQNAIRMLAVYPETDELVAAISRAFDNGVIDAQTKGAILTSALLAEPLPAEIPLPAHLPPLSRGYPTNPSATERVSPEMRPSR